MISTGQILAAGVVTGAGVTATSWLIRWRVQWIIAAALGSFILIVAWRGLSNLLQLNGDFLPAISVGDTCCLLLGAIAPAAVAVLTSVPERLRWLPAVLGGVLGFVANVVIL